MRISDWSSDVCSSDLIAARRTIASCAQINHLPCRTTDQKSRAWIPQAPGRSAILSPAPAPLAAHPLICRASAVDRQLRYRSEEHTSELQSLMRISYAVFCLKKQKNKYTIATP